ncbi:MAG: hypothetical protein JO003_04490, partial [Candidatus Eremiobacteraeota bacterium]|nr:hypothetical protein [Candidatus Eremiobacteraeota bacterium]
ARTLAIPFIAFIFAGLLAACGGSHGGALGQPQAFQAIPLGDSLAITDARLPKDTIGVGYPDQVGHVFSKKWKADVAGFTQSHYSQTLAFPPGTKITVTNISKAGEFHTLNVIATRGKPPANFPKNPMLSMKPSGGDKLVVGYRSGILRPGKSVSVTLVKGIYLIGCAFHYLSDNMRDVLVVEPGATPGPTATPPG